MDSKRLKALEMMINLGKANPTNSGIFNSVAEMAMSPQEDPEKSKRDKLTDLLLQGEMAKLSAGDTSALDSIDELMTGGYDAFARKLRSGQSEKELSLSDIPDEEAESQLANKYLQAYADYQKTGDYSKVKAFEQNNPTYDFELDKEAGTATASRKGSGNPLEFLMPEGAKQTKVLEQDLLNKVPEYQGIGGNIKYLVEGLGEQLRGGNPFGGDEVVRAIAKRKGINPEKYYSN